MRAMRSAVFLLVLALAPFGAPTDGEAQSEANSEVFVPADRSVSYDPIGYAPAVRVGDMLYVSGVTGAPVERDASDEELTANFVTIFETLKATLERAGASFDNVVLMESYHLDYVKNFFLFNAVKQRYIEEPYPAWTAVGIAELPPGAVAEMALTVWLGGTRQEAR